MEKHIGNANFVNIFLLKFKKKIVAKKYRSDS